MNLAQYPAAQAIERAADRVINNDYRIEITPTTVQIVLREHSVPTANTFSLVGMMNLRAAMIATGLVAQDADVNFGWNADAEPMLWAERRAS